jgi:glucose-6-phosphate dehydrogenase assembly protein OpcA
VSDNNARDRGSRSGEALWRESSPEDLESDLAALWREAAQTHPIARALMCNLVVVSPEGVFSGIDDLARRHPARTILLTYVPGSCEVAGPESVRIGLLTFGDASTRYGVELIAMSIACADQSIPSIVRAVARGDVPTTVWWNGDLSQPAPPEALTTMGRQLVYSSARWRNVEEGLETAASVLRRAHPPDLADLNWRRIAPLRRALVHALSLEPPHALGGAAIRVTCQPGEMAAASLLSGWLAGPLGKRARDVHFAETDDENFLAVVIDAGQWSVSAALSQHRALVTSSRRPPFVVAVPSESEAEAVASELRTLGHDAGLRRAIRALSSGAN